MSLRLSSKSTLVRVDTGSAKAAFKILWNTIVLWSVEDFCSGRYVQPGFSNLGACEHINCCERGLVSRIMAKYELLEQKIVLLCKCFIEDKMFLFFLSNESLVNGLVLQLIFVIPPSTTHFGRVAHQKHPGYTTNCQFSLQDYILLTLDCSFWSMA